MFCIQQSQTFLLFTLVLSPDAKFTLTDLETHANLINGGFSCQIGSKNTFGRIPIDQTIKETINKDTQTGGGTKGFSTKTNAVTKYYITTIDLVNYVRQFRRKL